VHFEFNERGDLISQTEDGETTTYEYSDDGLLEQWENIDGISQFAYNAQGRLAAVTFPDGTQHHYAYDQLGFRTATTRADGSWQDFDYDSTGNLTEYQSINEDGERYGQKLILNKENQVSRIEFQPQGQLAIKYNADGNPKSLAWGDDAMSCEYDASGRLIAIQSDMSGTGNYQYTDGEADIRKQLDDRTFPSLVNHRRASNTFGSLADIHYLRSHGSFGTVVNWNEELSILDLPTEIGLVNPDSLLRAADQRRRLYNTLAQDPILQRAFDKASNSFFLPPEYASANCVFTSTAVPTISAPTAPVAGQPVSITASVAWASPGCGPIKYRFTANGSVIFQGTGGLSKTISTIFSSVGNITITVRVMCSYGDSSVEYASVVVYVAPCDPDYDWHINNFGPMNTSWENNFATTSAGGNQRDVDGYIGARPWDGEGFDGGYPYETPPSETQFLTALADIEGYWYTPFQESCDYSYRIQVHISPSLTLTSSVQPEYIQITMSEYIFGGFAAAEPGTGLIWIDPFDGLGQNIVAHEFGHNLGFKNRSSGPTTDIMSIPGTPARDVQGYHARIIYEHY
jgi:YD repeat-containing protein